MCVAWIFFWSPVEKSPNTIFFFTFSIPIDLFTITMDENMYKVLKSKGLPQLLEELLYVYPKTFESIFELKPRCKYNKIELSIEREKKKVKIIHVYNEVKWVYFFLIHRRKRIPGNSFISLIFFLLLLILQPISQWHCGHTTLYDVLCKH